MQKYVRNTKRNTLNLNLSNHYTFKFSNIYILVLIVFQLHWASKDTEHALIEAEMRGGTWRPFTGRSKVQAAERKAKLDNNTSRSWNSWSSTRCPCIHKTAVLVWVLAKSARANSLTLWPWQDLRTPYFHRPWLKLQACKQFKASSGWVPGQFLCSKPFGILPGECNNKLDWLTVADLEILKIKPISRVGTVLFVNQPKKPITNSRAQRHQSFECRTRLQTLLNLLKRNNCPSSCLQRY